MESYDPTLNFFAQLSTPLWLSPRIIRWRDLVNPALQQELTIIIGGGGGGAAIRK